jgi:hypothetical protein
MDATGAKPMGAVIILQSSAITKAERGSMAQSVASVINTSFDLSPCRSKFESRLRIPFAFGKAQVASLLLEANTMASKGQFEKHNTSHYFERA